MTPETGRDPLRKIPTKHVPEIKAEIGSALKAARLRKEQTLEAAAKQTRIPKKYLEALESNRFEDFPALVYLRGFLKNYCDFLETDFEPLWRLISEEAAPAPKAAPAPAAAAHAPTHAPARTPAPALAGRPEDAPRPNATGAILVSILMVALLIFWVKRTSRENAPDAASAPPPPAALMPVAASVEPHLVLVLRKETWVSVGVDGVRKFAGLAPQGARQEWRAKKFFMLRTPDPGSVVLTLNGAPYALPAPDSSGGYRIEPP